MRTHIYLGFRSDCGGSLVNQTLTLAVSVLTWTEILMHFGEVRNLKITTKYRYINYPWILVPSQKLHFFRECKEDENQDTVNFNFLVHFAPERLRIPFRCIKSCWKKPITHDRKQPPVCESNTRIQWWRQWICLEGERMELKTILNRICQNFLIAFSSGSKLLPHPSTWQISAEIFHRCRGKIIMYSLFMCLPSTDPIRTKRKKFWKRIFRSSV